MDVSTLSLKPRELESFVLLSVLFCFVLESVESRTDAGSSKVWHSLTLEMTNTPLHSLLFPQQLLTLLPVHGSLFIVQDLSLRTVKLKCFLDRSGGGP